MTENQKSYKAGLVKVVVGRLAGEEEWTPLSVIFWHDGFDYDLNNHSASYFSELLWDSYMMGEEWKALLESISDKNKDQVFEIVGELHHESWKSWTDCGYEYDAREWIEKEKIREITGSDLEWFKEEDPERWKDFIGEEVVDAQG